MNLAVVALVAVALAGWATALLLARELSRVEALVFGQRPKRTVQLHGEPCDGQRVEIRDDENFAIVASKPGEAVQMVTMADHIESALHFRFENSVYCRVEPAPFVYRPPAKSPTRSRSIA